MISKLFYKLFLYSFLLFLISSCGTSYQGGFEKRKHLKGWHLQKKSNLVLTSSSKENDNLKKKKTENTVGLTIVDYVGEKNDDVSDVQLNRSGAQPIKKVLLSLNESETTSSSAFEKKDPRSLKKQNRLSNRLSSPKEIISAVPIRKNDVSEDRNEQKYSKAKVFFSVFGLVVLFVVLFLVFLFLGNFIASSFVTAGAVIMGFGLYLCISLLIYNISKFYGKVDGREVKSLKMIFLKVGLFLGSLALTLLLFNYFYNL